MRLLRKRRSGRSELLLEKVFPSLSVQTVNAILEVLGAMLVHLVSANCSVKVFNGRLSGAPCERSRRYLRMASIEEYVHRDWRGYIDCWIISILR